MSTLETFKHSEISEVLTSELIEEIGQISSEFLRQNLTEEY